MRRYGEAEMLTEGNTEKVKKAYKIIFIEQSNQSDGRFLRPIVSSLGEKYNVKYLRTLNIKEVQKAIDWADLVWLEWANQMI